MFFFRTVLLLSTLLVLVACTQSPLAQQGTLDLSHWDFEANPEVRLDGQWSLRSSIFAPTEQGFKALPDVWDGTSTSLPLEGKVLYSLKLLLPTDRTEWSLLLPECSSASRLWADGSMVLSTGTVGTTMEAEDAQVQMRIANLRSFGTELVINFEVSNFHSPNGGTNYSLRFGPKKQLEAHWRWLSFKASFLAGGLLVLGLINLFGYTFGGKSTGTVWYSVFAFVISLRTLITGSAPGLDLLPDAPYEVVTALKYLTAVGGVVAFGQYLKLSYPIWWQSITLTVFEFYALLLVLLCMVLPVKALTEVFRLYYVIPMVGSMFLCLAAVAWATLKQMEGARDQLVSVLMLFLAGLNDVIASQWEIPWGLILPDCLFVVMVYGTWRESVRTGVTYRLSFEQAQRLSRLDTMKDDFLARVTHELRTPLHGILGLLTAFEQGDFGPLTPRQAFHQKMLQTSSRRLLKMVNSILDFSQLRGGIQVGEFKVIALHPFVELLFEPFRAHLKPGVDLVNNVSVYLPAAWGEPGKVAQVVQNLLTNAIEHTTSGSITVEASVAQEKVILCVRDTGSGMTEEILKNAFSPFEQSQDSDTRAKNGLGLGLAVSSGLMSQMGETLKLESEIGRGTRALLTLPLATGEQLLTKDAGTNWHSESETLGVSALFPRQSPPELFEEQAKEPPSQRARILVVDDEPVNLMLLQRFLVKMNYEVLVATNGPEALEVLKSTKVHLMVLDIMMPGMSGYEVTRLVRQTYSLAELPILLLTAKNNLNDQLRGLQMGANDFLTKPFERDDLQTRLDFHLLLSTKSG